MESSPWVHRVRSRAGHSDARHDQSCRTKVTLMGMAVCGNKPTNRTGAYFEAAGRQWLPLAEMSRHFAPEVCAACKYWDSNNGDGLDADGARRLAVALEQAVVAGQIDAYLAARAKYLATLPNEVCE